MNNIHEHTTTNLISSLDSDQDRNVDKKRTNYIEWDEYFMATAFLAAKRSKDPSSQVGACIVNADKKIVGVGYNGMPIGCHDDKFPWSKTNSNKLETKYLYGFIDSTRITEECLEKENVKSLMDEAKIIGIVANTELSRLHSQHTPIVILDRVIIALKMDESLSDSYIVTKLSEFFDGQRKILMQNECIVVCDLSVNYAFIIQNSMLREVYIETMIQQYCICSQFIIKMICHAEMNAIMNKNSADVKHCTMYVGLFPCNECAKMIIQAGIRTVIYMSDKHWHKDETIAAKKMFDAVGVEYRQYIPKHERIVIDFSEINWNEMTQLPPTPGKSCK